MRKDALKSQEREDGAVCPRGRDAADWPLGREKRRQRATSSLLRRMWGETGAIALQIEPQAPLTGVCADFESADLV